MKQKKTNSFLYSTIVALLICIGVLFSLDFDDEAIRTLDPKIVNFAFFIFVGIISFTCFIILKFIFVDQSLFRKKTNRLIEMRRMLRKQHEALHQITTGNIIYNGDFEKATAQIERIAAETLEIDSVSTWLFSFNKEELNCTSCHSKAFHKRKNTISKNDFPGIFHKLAENRVLVMDSVELEGPDENFFKLLCEDLSSVMISPISINSRLIGIVCFCKENVPVLWSSDQQSFAGSIADFISMAMEASDRLKIENELRRRSLALESAVDGMAIISSAQNFVFVNQALLEIFGYQRESELLGKSWKSLYHADDVVRIQKSVTPRYKLTGKIKFEAIGVKKDGEFFPTEVSLTSIDGKEFVCSIVDITGRKKSEENSRESKKFLHKVINANPNLIFVKDSKGRFVLVNQAVADIYGTTIDNIIGKTDRDFNAENEEVEHFQLHDKAVVEDLKEVFIAEEKITDAEGNVRWLQTAKRPLVVGTDGEVQVLGVATDISERKKLQDQLLQSQKMEAIGQLAGGIAHDFNNYLTGIIGYIGLIRMSATGNREIEHASEMIEETAQKAAVLTEKLLGFARKGKNQNISVDLHSSVRDTFTLLSRTIEKSIGLDFDLRADISTIIGDPTQIQQVILNLAINARDAVNSGSLISKNNSKISVTSANVSFPETSEISGILINAGNYIVLKFKDSGCGIDPKIKDKIFEPFFTTKEPNRGTGMGLAMVYGIVKNHGGYIFVESEIGLGATFTIYLPCTERTLSQQIVKIKHAAVKGKGYILIVDDHEVIREVTSKMLLSLGYDVITASDGIEAIEKFSAHSSDIDLVILDMIMPNMGARECYNAIKRIKPNIRAILSTGYDRNNAVQEILNEGILGFVQKPYQLNKLSEVVAEVLQH